VRPDVVRTRVQIALLTALALLSAATTAVAEPAAEAQPPAWCAPELETVAEGVCYALPEGEAPTELLIFLHGVIAPRVNWQWAQQRSAARVAAAHGLAVLMPRGRRMLRTDHMKDWWTWPTARVAQQRVETEVIEQWWSAKRALEAQLGRPFERVYLFGFSNGAYYVSSLALRGRVAVDGFAAFAGGMAPKRIRPAAYADVPRVPFYVGYGHRDTTALRDAASLRKAFRVLQWPGKVVGRKRVGHAMTDSQAHEAIELFRKQQPAK